MLVVADTSPINYLILIQHETLLPALYTHVVIPPAVQRELQDVETPTVVRAWVAHPPSWFEVRTLQHPEETRALAYLGAGEREAMVLAHELQADLLLIDEDSGRREAHSRALTVTGTLGVLERAAVRGLIDLPSALARLQTTTFRVKHELIQNLLTRDAARKRQQQGEPGR
jgi:predicted nucleic acid-binding protein